MDKHEIEKIARSTGFTKRTGKLSGRAFLKALIFNDLPINQTTLNVLKSDLKEHSDCSISREALHKRFTPEAVNFLNQVLSMQLANNIDFSDNPAIQSFFSGIYLKDSTKLKLPDCFVNEFPGYGDKYGKTSDLSIQYEYAILSGKCKRLYFTK